MTNPTPHGQVPEALRLAEQYDYGDPATHGNAWKAAVCTELRRLHAYCQELESQVIRDCMTHVQNPESNMKSAVYAELPLSVGEHKYGGGLFTEVHMRDFADRTHALRMQAAPKAAPGVGNSGFDHKTAADFLSGKTISDEAVRKFVQASRWAHDEKASLSAMLISVRGELASREAEIALLKKALLEAEAAPQQEAQEPAFWMNEKGHTWSHSDWKQFPKHRAKYPIPLYPHFPAPQPAPDCHHRPLCDECAALAAQGGKDAG